MHFFLLNSKYQVINQKAMGYLMQYSDGVEFVFLALDGVDKKPEGISTAQLTGTPMGATEVLNLFMNWDSFSLDGITYHGFSCVLPATFTQVAGPLPLNLVLTSTSGEVIYSTTFNILVNASSTPTSWIESMNYAQWKELISYFGGDYSQFLKLSGGAMNDGATVTFSDEAKKASASLSAEGLYLANAHYGATFANIGSTRYGSGYIGDTEAGTELGLPKKSGWFAWANEEADSDLSLYAKKGDIPQGVALLGSDNEFAGENVFSGGLVSKGASVSLRVGDSFLSVLTKDGTEIARSYLPNSSGWLAYSASSRDEANLALYAKLTDLDSYLTKETFDNEKANFAKLNQSNVFTKDITIQGDLTVNGTFTKVSAETLDTKNYTIGLAIGNTKPLTSYVGLYAKKYDGTNDGALVFDNTGTAYVGDVTADKDGKITDVSMQPILTRSESSDLADKAILFWSADESKATQRDSNGNVWTFETLEGIAAKQGELSDSLAAEASARATGDKESLTNSKAYTDEKLKDYAKASSLDSYAKRAGDDISGAFRFTSAEQTKKTGSVDFSGAVFEDTEGNSIATLGSQGLLAYDSSQEAGESARFSKSGVDYTDKGGVTPETRSVFPLVGTKAKVYIAYSGTKETADLSLYETKADLAVTLQDYAKKGDVPTGTALLDSDNAFTGNNSFSKSVKVGSWLFGNGYVGSVELGNQLQFPSASGYLAYASDEEGANLSLYVRHADLDSYVTKAEDETISGVKTFTGRIVSNFTPTDKAEPNIRLNPSGVFTIGTYDSERASDYLMLERTGITINSKAVGMTTIGSGGMTVGIGSDGTTYGSSGIITGENSRIRFPQHTGNFLVSSSSAPSFVPGNGTIGQVLTWGDGAFLWKNVGDVYSQSDNIFFGSNEFGLGSTLKVSGTLNIHGANFPDFPAKGAYLLHYDSGDMAWVDESEYAKKAYVDAQDEATLASAKAYTDGKISGIDYSAYVTKDGLTEALKPYATTASVTASLASYVTKTALSTELKSYVTNTALTTTLKDYITSADLNDALTSYAKLDDLSDYVPLVGDANVGGVKTFLAPAKASGEQHTAIFDTSNGGALYIGKEGPNSGTMLRFDQVKGTPRLLFRASATAGSMVWSQPEKGAVLYFDLTDSTGTTQRAFLAPKTGGLLASPKGTYSDVTASKVTATNVSIPNVSATTATASKATLKGTKTIGNADVGEEVSVGTSLTGTKTFVTGVTLGSLTTNSTSTGGLGYLKDITYSPASASSTDTVAKAISGGSFTQSYNSTSKKLVISFTPAAVTSTSKAVTAISGGSVTKSNAYLHYESAKQSGTGTVGLATSKIAPAKASESTMNDWSFADVETSKVTLGTAISASKVVATDVTASKIS